MHFKQYLEEGRDAPLYHATTLGLGANIIASNLIEASNGYGNSKETVSLTRSLKTAILFITSSETPKNTVIFELDQRKLAQRHKIMPYNYWYDNYKGVGNARKPDKGTFRSKMNEYEERVVGDIKNINRYITKIYLSDRLPPREVDNYLTFENNKLFQHPLLFYKGEFVNAK